MQLKNCNPFLRHAEIQHLILEGTGSRLPYDHRLIYILENSGEIIIGGKQHCLGINSLVLLRPETEYHCCGNMRGVVLNFDLTCNASEFIVPRCPSSADSFDKAAVFDRESVNELEVPFIGTGNAAIKEILLQLVESYRAGSSYCDTLCSGLMKQLLCKILLKNDTENDLCGRVKAYIHTNATAIKDNFAVANAFGYSTVYLAELFSKQTGTTLHTAIMKEKLAAAVRWLENTDEPIAEIAESCGFCSRTHFCTVFKKYYGISPTQFRKK